MNRRRGMKYRDHVGDQVGWCLSVQGEQPGRKALMERGPRGLVEHLMAFGERLNAAAREMKISTITGERVQIHVVLRGPCWPSDPLDAMGFADTVVLGALIRQGFVRGDQIRDYRVSFEISIPNNPSVDVMVQQLDGE